MPIRIPQKADTDTQSAFQDVEKALAELSARLDQITELEQKVKELSTVSDTPRPSFITQGDTVIEGDLRVEGGLAVRGDVDAPQTLDGIVVATPESIGSSAQRVVEVHGSLAVLNGLSSDSVRTRTLFVPGHADPFKIVHGDSGSTTAPDSISGLSGWWKADAGVYEDAGTDSAETGDSVYQWNDQSGNSRHFSQATATNRPTYVTNVVNGNPVIRFDGTDNYMDTTATMDDFMDSTAGTIFIAGYVHTITTSGASVYANDQVFSDQIGGPSVRHCLGLRTTPNITAFHYDGSEDVATKSEDVTGEWKTFLYMVGSGNVYLGVSDARTASLASSASGAATSMAGILRLGANYDTSIFTQIDIAEVLTYNVALSEANRMSVERYLANKYGISIAYGITTRSGDSFRIEDSLGNSIFRVDSNGDVYVGATMLDVP